MLTAKQSDCLIAACTALECANVAISNNDRMAAWRAVAHAMGQVKACLPDATVVALERALLAQFGQPVTG